MCSLHLLALGQFFLLPTDCARVYTNRTLLFNNGTFGICGSPSSNRAADLLQRLPIVSFDELLLIRLKGLLDFQGLLIQAQPRQSWDRLAAL